MDDVLAGPHAAWELLSDSVLIRYERGIRAPKLFQALGERRIPFRAMTAVTLSPGRRGTLVLHAAPRPGADPLMDAAAGQLKEACDPYRLVLPARSEEHAVQWAQALQDALKSDGGEPPDEYEEPLVDPPVPPRQFKAYDGKAVFDGESVAFHWFRTGASSAKWRAGDQTYPVETLSGVHWSSPATTGHLRLLPREGAPAGSAPPEEDPAAVVFGLGYGPVHESLPFAAAVLAAIRARTAHRTELRVATGQPAAGRRDPADIAERIRHLGELHQAGLVTDSEFSSKKAELLAEL